MTKLRNTRRRQHDAWLRREIAAGRGLSRAPWSIVRADNRDARRTNRRLNRECAS